jgi:hypothetical protein
MNITEIAKSFSNGAFEKTYPFIAEDAEWIVIEENHFIGKQAVMDNCEQVSAYFKSVTTHFTTINIISCVCFYCFSFVTWNPQIIMGAA